MKNLKGYTKLSVQIALLAISMVALSFVTENQIWLDYFCFLHDTTDLEEFKYGCGLNSEHSIHYHWNYRGWIYFFTGLAYFVLTCVKIGASIEKSINQKEF